MNIDAHCHTNCSDGNVTIEERIAMIKAAGYQAATITDHDFISGEQVRRATQARYRRPFRRKGADLGTFQNATRSLVGRRRFGAGQPNV